MKPKHMMLALLVAALWGVNFVVIRVGLRDFPPLLLASLRFLVAALPALFLPRPALPWRTLILTGSTLFVGQFGFLFSAMAVGMPAGLASVTLQAQAFFTILIAALFQRERPSGRHMAGTAIAFAGLAVIGSTAGTGGFTLPGLGLVIAAALSWALGNIQLRTFGKVDMLATMVWLSVVPPVPLFALSLLLEGRQALATAVTSAGWTGIGSLLYLAVIATLVGYGIWGHLLKRYPASTVAPFALMVPIFGTLSAFLLLGEAFSSHRLLGMALVVAGLCAITLPTRRKAAA